MPCLESSMRLKLLMYFSRSRSLASSSFRYDAGTSTLLCLACTALRMQVRKSATGSETDTKLLLGIRAPERGHAIRRPFPRWSLPAGLDDARNLATQGQLP